MKNFLKKEKDPILALDADIERARKRCDRFAERSAKAKQKAEEDTRELGRLTDKDADDQSISSVQASLRGALETAEHFTKSLRAAEQHVAGLERNRAELIKQKQIVETVASIEADRNELMVEFKAEFDKICAWGANVTERIGRHTYEARAIASFMQQAPHEIAAGLEMVDRGVAGYIGLVVSGAAPSTFPKPEPIPSLNEPAASMPQVAGLVAMKHICWSEGGNVRVASKGWPVVLPSVLAEHAMATRAALPPGHFDAAELASNPRRSRDLPRIADCVALDKIAEEAKQAAIEERDAQLTASEIASSEQPEVAAPFERIDRGPTLIGTANFNW